MCDQSQRRCQNDNSFADDLNTSGIVSAESSLCATIHKRAGVVHTVLPLGMGASGGDFSPVRHTQSPHTKNGTQTRTRHKPEHIHTHISTYIRTYLHTHILTNSHTYVHGAQQATRHPRVASVLCFPHVPAFVQPLRLQHAGYRASARTREHVEGEYISSHAGYPCGRRDGQTTCSLVCYQCCLWLSLSLLLPSPDTQTETFPHARRPLVEDLPEVVPTDAGGADGFSMDARD